MSKCKYNYSSLMGKTRKNVKTKKSKKDLEDLIEEENLDLSESESDYSTSDTGSDYDETEDTSISKELNEMMNGTIDSVKDGDLTIPAIGLGLIAMIGFAIYKGVKI